MPYLPIWIPPNSTIGINEFCTLWTWDALWLRMSDLFHIGYSAKPCSLTFLNCVRSTLEWNSLKSLPHPGPYFWVSSCRCGTCLHVILGNYFTPSTTEGRWTYLLLFLWTLRPQSCARWLSPSWYYMKILDRKLGVFLIPPTIIISIMKSSSCGHESHWILFPWFFISRLCGS